jgi:hypothetical protein
LRPVNRLAKTKEGTKLQAQQSLTLQKPSLATAVAIMATGLAASLALALVVIADRPATLSTPAVVTLHVVGADQVAHNRSEEGLAISSSVGGEQITHNRSEEGLGKAT